MLLNHLRRFREDRLISVAELARKAGISPLTIAKIEKGESCRLETKNKILKARGISPFGRAKVSPEN